MSWTDDERLDQGIRRPRAPEFRSEFWRNGGFTFRVGLSVGARASLPKLAVVTVGGVCGLGVGGTRDLTSVLSPVDAIWALAQQNHVARCARRYLLSGYYSHGIYRGLISRRPNAKGLPGKLQQFPPKI
ncbi:MAG: hypothetical protein O2981_02840 [Proteobacteria bacterium]|nr:hypothetical protein [Pseudomonadota bacterium]